jgi:hypothetical protein
MSTKLILLRNMPDEIMLLVEYPSGVRYENQVGGVVCYRERIEGVLSPVDVSREGTERIQNCPYPSGAQGITGEIADTIDYILSTHPGARHLTVDRDRIDESWEAWVHVRIEAPTDAAHDVMGSYSGLVYGFGSARGVLTWPNSD